MKNEIRIQTIGKAAEGFDPNYDEKKLADALGIEIIVWESL